VRDEEVELEPGIRLGVREEVSGPVEVDPPDEPDPPDDPLPPDEPPEVAGGAVLGMA
jgi:hypothetical protein